MNDATPLCIYIFHSFFIDETFPLRLLEGEKVKVWVVRMEKFQHWSAEGPAESVLPLLTQVKRPSREVAGHILHSHYSLCPVFVHHCLAWLSDKTKQV